MRFPGFIGPSYTLRSVNVDAQRCVNLYPEVDEQRTGKEQEVLHLLGTPGLELLAEGATGAVRGLFTASSGALYAVIGLRLYRVNSDWGLVELGVLLTNSGTVVMADNGLHLVLVDGPNGYVYTFASGVFARITDPDFHGADRVAFQDGYFIFNRPNTDQFYISNLYGTSFDALDFDTAEGAPDRLISLISDHRELWLFGDQTTEVWFNSGDPDFPFSRIQGAFIEHGCAAKHSVAKLDNVVFWLGADDKGAGVVWQSVGYQPQRVSTYAVELALQGYGNLSGATAYTYQQEGHSFYVLNVPGAATTWVFDTGVRLWHERTYTSGGVQTRHRAENHAFAYNTHVVGDYQTSKLYRLGLDKYTDDGAVITRLRSAPHLTQGLKRLFYGSFQLDMETGVGLDGAGQGSDPQVMLQYSDDGGHVWSNERWVSCGKLGEYRFRALWRRLGQSRDRIFQVKVTDPVKVALIGAEIEAVQGGS